MPRAAKFTTERLRESGSEATAFLVMAVFRGAAAIIKKREQYQELRLLQQGITDSPSDWRRHKELGTSVERSIAFKRLYDALDKRTHELAAYERVTCIEAPALDDYLHDQLFSMPHNDRLDGTYSVFFLLDPRPEVGGLVAINKHDNEKYGATYTVTQLNADCNSGGSRDGVSFAIGRDNWNSGTPWVDVNNIRRHGDRLDEALLSGELFRTNNLLMSAASQEQVAGGMMSAEQAAALSKLVPQLIPITQALDAR